MSVLNQHSYLVDMVLLQIHHIFSYNNLLNPKCLFLLQNTFLKRDELIARIVRKHFLLYSPHLCMLIYMTVGSFQT